MHIQRTFATATALLFSRLTICNSFTPSHSPENKGKVSPPKLPINCLVPITTNPKLPNILPAVVNEPGDIQEEGYQSADENEFFPEIEQLLNDERNNTKSASDDKCSDNNRTDLSTDQIIAIQKNQQTLTAFYSSRFPFMGNQGLNP